MRTAGRNAVSDFDLPPKPEKISLVFVTKAVLKPLERIV